MFKKLYITFRLSYYEHPLYNNLTCISSNCESITQRFLQNFNKTFTIYYLYDEIILLSSAFKFLQIYVDIQKNYLVFSKYTSYRCRLTLKHVDISLVYDRVISTFSVLSVLRERTIYFSLSL